MTTALPQSELRADKLTKVYHQRAVVNQISLSIRQGEIVGILGPNGAGKTTTFYMLVGSVQPQQGQVYIDETAITSLPMTLVKLVT